MKKLILPLMLLLGSMAIAQDLPRASQACEVEQTIGMTEIEVEYNRPNKKGRVIFGDLVPYGEVWRTGADGATTIEIEHNIQVQGKNLAAGKYAIFTIPGKEEWTVIFNTVHDQWGAYDYDESKDALRITVGVKPMSHVVESMMIYFDLVVGTKAFMIIQWDRTRIEIPISVSVDDKIDSEITKALETGDKKAEEVYVTAGRYYLSEKSFDKAEMYFDKAIGANGDAWMGWWFKARAKEGKEDFKAAVKFGEKALKLATKNAGEEGFEYEDALKEQIAEWKTK